MLPLLSLPIDEKQERDIDKPDEPSGRKVAKNTPDEKKSLDSLPDEIKDLVAEKLAAGEDCKDLGKWCALLKLHKCDDSVWQLACTIKKYPAKPTRFTSWRIWYARNCNPEWATRLDRQFEGAVFDGDLNLVTALLNRGADVDARNDVTGYNALYYATTLWDLAMLRLLIARGANIRANEDFALRRASTRGWTEAVRLLLDNHADVHAKNDEALILAARHNRVETVKLLFERQANINARQLGGQDTVLMVASRHGHQEVVELLVSLGADISATSLGGDALARASQFGHLKVVEFLVDKGADVHANNDKALMMASRYGHLDVVRLLLDRRANIDAQDNNYGRSALMWASEGGHLEVVRLLRERGAKEASLPAA